MSLHNDIKSVQRKHCKNWWKKGGAKLKKSKRKQTTIRLVILFSATMSLLQPLRFHQELSLVSRHPLHLILNRSRKIQIQMGRLLAWAQLCKRNFLVRWSCSNLSQVDSLFPPTASTPISVQPLRRQWYDRLADSILGDDEPASPSSRYALICEKCFAHNGLVKESMWEDARKLFKICHNTWDWLSILLSKEYVCPKCNHFNASTRSKRSSRHRNTSPSASATSSPLGPASVTPTTPQQQVSSDQRLHSPQELDLPNVDRMEVDTEVDASAWKVFHSRLLPLL